MKYSIPLLFALSFSAQAASLPTWDYSTSVDTFTDVETKRVMALSPYSNSKFGNPIAIYVGCTGDDLYTGIIWDEVIASLPTQEFTSVLFRVGSRSPETAIAEIAGSTRGSTYFSDFEAEKVIAALKQASENGEQIVFGVETFSSARREARFDLDGYTEKAGVVLDFCGYSTS